MKGTWPEHYGEFFRDVLKKSVMYAEDDWCRAQILAAFVDQQAPDEFRGMGSWEKARIMLAWVESNVGDFVEALRLLWRAVPDYWEPFPGHEASLLSCADRLYQEEG